MTRTYADELTAKALAREAEEFVRQTRGAVDALRERVHALEHDAGADLEEAISALEGRVRALKARLVELESGPGQRLVRVSATPRARRA